MTGGSARERERTRAGGGPEVSERPTDSVEFFGVRLTVKDPRLAALLNSDVTDDVVVIGRRAIDLVAVDDEDEAEASEGPKAEGLISRPAIPRRGLKPGGDTRRRAARAGTPGPPCVAHAP